MIKRTPISYLVQFFSKGDKRSIRLKRHVFYSFITRGIHVLTGLFYVPLLIDFVDKDKYGIWLTIASVLTWFEFFNIGLGNGLRNNLTKAIAKGDQILARKYISTTYALISLITLSLLSLFYLFNPIISWKEIFNVEIIKEKELTLLMFIVITLFFLRLIFKLVGNLYFAFQRPAITNSFGTIGNIISILVILLLVKTNINGSLILLGIILGIVPLLVLISFSFFAFFGQYKHLAPNLKYVDFKYKGELMGLGFRFFVIKIAAIIIYTSSNFLIIHFFSPEEVTKYNIVFRYYQIPLMFLTIITTSYWSSVTDAHVKNENDWLKKHLKYLNIISIVFIIGIVVMTMFSDFFFKLWLGDRIVIQKNLIAAMALLTIIKIVLSPYSAYINGLGKLRLSIYTLIISIIIFIPLALLLLNKMETASAVIYAAIAVSSLSLIITPIQTYKILNGTNHKFWSK